MHNQTCQICNQKTPSHFVEIKCDGETLYELEICSLCRKILTNPIPDEVFTLDQFFDIFENPETSEVIDVPPCPHCQQTFHDIEMTGLLGCSKCYDHFGDLVNHFISEVQEEDTHHGKIHRENRKSYISELKLKLAHAKEHQKFVEAAQLVNEIKRLEK